MMLLAIVNGTIRDFSYRALVGDFLAHQLSTITLLLLFSGYFWWLFRRWPLTSTRQAWRVGSGWLAMTLAFEFGFGHWIAGHSWTVLFQAYALHEGRLWLFIPLMVWLGPWICFRRISATTRQQAQSMRNVAWLEKSP